MTYIPHTIGKVYAVAHLRPFDLELAKAGHPLADYWGYEIRLFRDLHGDDNVFGYDSWEQNLNPPTWFASNIVMKIALSKRIRLAPLAINHDPRTGKDEPLHVGDVIELKGSPNYGEPWLPHIVGAGSLIGINNIGWRWPVEATDVG